MVPALTLVLGLALGVPEGVEVALVVGLEVLDRPDVLERCLLDVVWHDEGDRRGDGVGRGVGEGRELDGRALGRRRPVCEARATPSEIVEDDVVLVVEVLGHFLVSFWSGGAGRMTRPGVWVSSAPGW